MLAIITVNYENYQVVSELLKSMDHLKKNGFKLFVSDLSEKKKKLKGRPYSQIIFSQNLGYAYGVNIGLKTAISEGITKFAVINNDTELKSDFVKRVLVSLEKNPKSIIGGKIYYYQGFEYHKSSYKKEDLGKVLWYAGGHIDWNNVIGIHRGVDEIDEGQYDKFQNTEFITGCLMCFDLTVVERIGFWDEKYFLYYEDADWCEKAKRAGIKLYYDPKIIIWHKNAQSTGGSGSLIHQKYQQKNRLKFGLKYAPLKTKLHLLKNYILDSLY